MFNYKQSVVKKAVVKVCLMLLLFRYCCNEVENSVMAAYVDLVQQYYRMAVNILVIHYVVTNLF